MAVRVRVPARHAGDRRDASRRRDADRVGKARSLLHSVVNPSSASDARPTLPARLLVAFAVAIAAGLIAWYKSRHGALWDYAHYENAGHALLTGADPYPSFIYPLPAAMWAAPFAVF